MIIRSTATDYGLANTVLLQHLPYLYGNLWPVHLRHTIVEQEELVHLGLSRNDFLHSLLELR